MALFKDLAMSLGWMFWIQWEEGPTGFENSQNADYEMHSPFEEKTR